MAQPKFNKNWPSKLQLEILVETLSKRVNIVKFDISLVKCVHCDIASGGRGRHCINFEFLSIFQRPLLQICISHA